MTFSAELTWRGFVHQSTLANLSQLNEKQWTFYHGYDASADSQTVGNLAAMMFDRVFLRHGHSAVMLAGGATSLIGDPGGKDAERPVQDEKTIAHNVSKAEEQLKKILGDHKFKLVNNLDWTKDLKLLPFLRDIGKQFSMTPLLQRDYIAKRIGVGGSGISYTELSYTLLQGYDYLYLFDKYGCTLQIGGSDQWGNCISGVELIRRMRGAEAHAITLPLIVNKATGKKFGKSEDGAIWLDEAKTSVFKFYQFWLNTDDESVESYLKIFTDLDKPTITLVMAEFDSNRNLRMAQRVLAYEVSKIVHGKKRADEAVKATKVLYGEGDFLELGKNEMHILKHELTVVKAHDDLSQLLVDAKLASSKSEGRTFLQAGAVSVNGQKAGPQNLNLFVKGNNLLKRGKNSFAIVEKK
ncbi:MAG: tyrosine--tRNA ligase [Candidatus Saccharimonadales bacterium]